MFLEDEEKEACDCGEEDCEECSMKEETETADEADDYGDGDEE